MERAASRPPAAAPPDGSAAPELLVAPGLGAPHGFATRRGGASSGDRAGLNVGDAVGDDPALVAAHRAALLAAFGALPDAACALRQVHGARVVEAGPDTAGAEADAAVSDDPARVLVVLTADCAPLLLHAPDVGAVGAAHCGWRGTAAGLAARTVRALGERYGADPARVRVAIGPRIGPCCYQVGPEVVAALTAYGMGAAVSDDPDPAARAEGRARVDLAEANRIALEAAGVPRANVEALDACTACDPERFYSHRRDRGRTGRHWALVRAPGAVGGAA